MTHEEAARILDPETTREALRPYLYDPERRLKVVEDACRVAEKVLRNMTTGEPLTLEQLREMDGQPVLLVFDFELEPMTALVEYAEAADCIILTNNLGGRSEFYSDEELRETGIKAYAYHPTRIDREAWSKCGYCGRAKIKMVRMDLEYNDSPGSPERLNPNRCPIFCPICGRPLTEEAWNELEKRFRG